MLYNEYVNHRMYYSGSIHAWGACDSSSILDFLTKSNLKLWKILKKVLQYML